MAKYEAIGKSNEWYRPKYIFDALGCNFDLDVSAPLDREFCHVPANSFITEDSLNKEWTGYVWMNAPFGNQNDKFNWLNKFILHGNGIALTHDRTSAPWWHYIAKNSDAVLFVDGKIKFIKPDGSLGLSPGNGTCLFAKGSDAYSALLNAQTNGLGKLYT